jgi:hypothetical protein
MCWGMSLLGSLLGTERSNNDLSVPIHLFIKKTLIQVKHLLDFAGWMPAHPHWINVSTRQTTNLLAHQLIDDFYRESI